MGLDTLRTSKGLLALLSRRGVGPRKALKAASAQQGLLEDQDFSAAVDRAESELERWARHGIHVRSFFEEGYPAAFRSLADSPPLLWYRGNFSALATASVAVVGTREPTDFGLEVARKVSAEAVAQEFAVVSGLARGIDVVAHQTALDEGGTTIAVLPSGLGTVYPARHEPLAQQIVDSGGLLISELHPARRAHGNTFVARDRLQSVLSRAVFICQTGRTGGTLHTARFAFLQGRPIYCTEPESPSPADEGSHLLLTRAGSELPGLLKEWSHSWTVGDLPNWPVATRFDARGLSRLLSSLRNPRSDE